MFLNVSHVPVPLKGEVLYLCHACDVSLRFIQRGNTLEGSAWENAPPDRNVHNVDVRGLFFMDVEVIRTTLHHMWGDSLQQDKQHASLGVGKGMAEGNECPCDKAYVPTCVMGILT